MESHWIESHFFGRRALDEEPHNYFANQYLQAAAAKAVRVCGSTGSSSNHYG